MSSRQLSPGVEVREFDISVFLAAANSTEAASVGEFAWGPVEHPVQVGSQPSIVEAFHKPTDTLYNSFMNAWSFAAYSAAQRLIRVVDEGTALNSVAAGSPLLIKNAKHFSVIDEAAAATANIAAAKYPGDLGNSLKLLVVDAFTYPSLTDDEKAIFNIAPATSSYAASVGAKNDELHVAVIDVTGAVNGNPGEVLEKWEFLSKAVDGRAEDGTRNYYKEIVNRESAYAWILGAPAASAGGSAVASVTLGGTSTGTWTYANVTISGDGAGAVAIAHVSGGRVESIEILEGGTGYTAATVTITGDGAGVTGTVVLGAVEFDDDFGAKLVVNTVPSSFKNMDAKVDVQFTGGANGNKAALGDYVEGWAILADSETIDTTLFYLGSDLDDSKRVLLAQSVTDNVAEARKDCVVSFGPRLADVKHQTQSAAVDNVKAFYQAVNRPSSYVIKNTTGWKKMYDPFNDKIRWVSMDADVVGLCANTDIVADLWWSPAGLNRGQIRNVIDLAWNPNKPSRDALYPLSINPIIQTANEGVILFGDRTGQIKESPFRYVNVRRLFNSLKRKIGLASRYFLFEFNDEFTRGQLLSMTEPELEQIQGRRGISAFRVICDETNNTPAVIDAGEFVGTFLIKPARSINFIRLNFVAVGNSVSFDEAASVQY